MKIFHVCLVGLCLFPHWMEVTAEELPEPRAKDHRRLMFYIDEDGNERPVTTREDWGRRRKDILVGLEASMGKFPDRSQLGPVKYSIVEESRFENEKFVREKLRIESGDGDSFPAWRFVPKGLTAPRPGILALHQTNGKLGKDEVAGLGGSKNLAYGLELAERGYIVIDPDYPTLGEYPYDFEADRYLSGSMKGIWNHQRCIDLMCEMKEVDGSRIGTIGHSLGGHNAIWLAVVDPRIKVTVSSCGWTPTHYYYGGNLRGWDGERYMTRIRDVYKNSPDLAPWDYYEMVAAMAPGGFFSCSPTGDDNFEVKGVKLVIPEAQKVYDLLGASDRLQVRYPECTHDFPPEVREEAYQFMDRVLGWGALGK